MILVTGATGFLGSKLVEILISQQKRIIATKRNSSIIPVHLAQCPWITWIDADVRDYFSLAELFPNVTQVYHCAAVVSFHSQDIKEMMDINIRGTNHIVNLCLKHDARLVYVSSIAAIGASDGKVVTEEGKWEYNSRESAYSLSKYKSEMEVWRGIEEGLNAVIVNPSVIMGKEAGTKGSGQILTFASKNLGIYPLGATGIVDVDDVAQLMSWLMSSEIQGERFILNSDNITNKELLTKITALLNKNRPKMPANRIVLGLAWRFLRILELLTHKRQALTKDAARATQSYYTFSNKKIKQLTNFEFKSIDQILKDITANFKSTETK